MNCQLLTHLKRRVIYNVFWTLMIRNSISHDLYFLSCQAFPWYPSCCSLRFGAHPMDTPGRHWMITLLCQIPLILGLWYAPSFFPFIFECIFCIIAVACVVNTVVVVVYFIAKQLSETRASAYTLYYFQLISQTWMNASFSNIPVWEHQ